MDAIPYTVHPREDTGLYNGKLGVWLFLASEVMLFGALFSSYVILRTGAAHWPLGATYLSIPLGALNTAILITSSVTMVFAWVALRQNDFKKYELMLGSTILLALIFLVVKSFEYAAKFSHHHFPQDNTYLAIYFTLTGLHALHIIGGLVVMIYLWGPGATMWKTDPLRFTNRVEIIGIYWSFVDFIWIFLFPLLYLL